MLQVPFTTDSMTTEELLAKYGAVMSDVKYELAMYQPARLTMTIFHEGLAWKAEFYSLGNAWDLAAFSVSAGETCTPEPDDVKYIFEIIRKVMG